MYTHDVFAWVHDRKSVLRIIALFSIACGRMGRSSSWTSLTVYSELPGVSFPDKTIDSYGFLPKVVIMTHHGWIWQARLLGKRWQTNLQLYGLRGDFDYRHLQKTKREREMRSSVSTSEALYPSHLPPWVSPFPVCRYGCMNWLQVQWIGCAALLRAAQVPQRIGPLIDKALVFCFQPHGV